MSKTIHLPWLHMLQGKRANRGNDLTFVALVALAYVSLLGLPADSFSLIRIALLLASGIVYLVAGTSGFAAVEREGRRGPAVVYFAAQIALGATIAHLSGLANASALVLLPLASQSVRVLPRRWVAAVCVVIVAGLIFPALFLSRDDPNVTWGRAVQGLLSIGAGLAFTVIFSQIALNERRARTRGEQLARELSEANRKLREYASQVEELATTQERNRLAREIHDGLGHYLTVINMQLQAARATLDSDRRRAEAILAKAQGLSGEALAEVRRSVAALRASPLEDRPLPAALAALVDEANATGVRTELVVAGAPRPLAPQAELTLYRAAQEALTNVRKHANAGRAWVALDYGDKARVRLTVQDDGVGATETRGGFGLLGLRERVQLLGGVVDIRTGPGRGLELTVDVPG